MIDIPPTRVKVEIYGELNRLLDLTRTGSSNIKEQAWRKIDGQLDILNVVNLLGESAVSAISDEPDPQQTIIFEDDV